MVYFKIECKGTKNIAHNQAKNEFSQFLGIVYVQKMQ